MGKRFDLSKNKGEFYQRQSNICCGLCPFCRVFSLVIEGICEKMGYPFLLLLVKVAPSVFYGKSGNSETSCRFFCGNTEGAVLSAKVYCPCYFLFVSTMPCFIFSYNE
jgi:hypothetical protein